MDRIAYARFCSRLDLCRSVLLEFAHGEYDVTEHRELADAIAALPRVLHLPPGWEHPGFAALLDQRVAFLKDKARRNELGGE